MAWGVQKTRYQAGTLIAGDLNETAFSRDFRKRVKGVLLPTEPVERRLLFGIGRGLRMMIDFQDGKTGMYLGLYEVELNRHLRALCRPGFRSFDIGGADGYDALIIAKYPLHCRIGRM